MDGFIGRPSVRNQNVAQDSTSKKRPGPATLPFKAKKRAAKYKEASKIADSSSVEALTKATAIKANKEGLTNTAHILRSLEDDPEETATNYRKASKAYKKRCKIVLPKYLIFLL